MPDLIGHLQVMVPSEKKGRVPSKKAENDSTLGNNREGTITEKNGGDGNVHNFGTLSAPDKKTMTFFCHTEAKGRVYLM